MNNYANKMVNLEEMDKCLEMYNFPRLNQEEIENMKRSTTNNEIETVKQKQKSPNKQKCRTKDFEW